MFSRWQGLTEKSKLVNECRLVTNMLASLTFTIKSATDSCFMDSKKNQLIEKTLLNLYKNMNHNISDTFKRWRDINNIEKLKEKMTDKEKESTLKVLNSLLHNSKHTMIRDAINKFRLNRKIVDIQRHFLKRLLMSKAGMVVIAFKKIQGLPEKKKNPKQYDTFLKFERGLHDFFTSTIKRSYKPIKNELQ